MSGSQKVPSYFRDFNIFSYGKYKLIFDKKNICITFIYCWINVEDVGPVLCKYYTNVLCFLVLLLHYLLPLQVNRYCLSALPPQSTIRSVLSEEQTLIQNILDVYFDEIHFIY